MPYTRLSVTHFYDFSIRDHLTPLLFLFLFLIQPFISVFSVSCQPTTNHNTTIFLFLLAFHILSQLFRIYFSAVLTFIKLSSQYNSIILLHTRTNVSVYLSLSHSLCYLKFEVNNQIHLYETTTHTSHAQENFPFHNNFLVGMEKFHFI